MKNTQGISAEAASFPGQTRRLSRAALGCRALKAGAILRDISGMGCEVGNFPLALVTLILIAGTSCKPTNYNFQRLEIASSLHLNPKGDISLREPDHGSFYFIFHATSGVTSVDHFIKNPGKPRERMLYLETGHDQILDRTVKVDELLKGPFGTLSAEKTCFFTSPLERGHSSVSVGLKPSSLEHEIPAELSTLPTDLPPLTSISLVRIFRTAPQYLVVSANYEATGELGNVRVNEARAGNIVAGNPIKEGFVRSGTMGTFSAEESAHQMQQYGIPWHIDIQQYLRARRLQLPPGAFPQVMTLLHQHYGYNRVIQQNELKDENIVSSRFLQPSVTKEEVVLNPDCESRFRRQRAAGLSTVQ